MKVKFARDNRGLSGSPRSLVEFLASVSSLGVVDSSDWRESSSSENKLSAPHNFVYEPSDLYKKNLIPNYLYSIHKAIPVSFVHSILCVNSSSINN